LWLRLDDLPDLVYDIGAPFEKQHLVMRLARKQTIELVFWGIKYHAHGTLIRYGIYSGDQGSQVNDASQLPRMYAELKRAGARDNEIECLMLPLLSFIARIIHDHPRE
jgi:hypothetical protein